MPSLSTYALRLGPKSERDVNDEQEWDYAGASILCCEGDLSSKCSMMRGAKLPLVMNRVDICVSFPAQWRMCVAGVLTDATVGQSRLILATGKLVVNIQCNINLLAFALTDSDRHKMT